MSFDETVVVGIVVEPILKVSEGLLDCIELGIIDGSDDNVTDELTVGSCDGIRVGPLGFNDSVVDGDNDGLILGVEVTVGSW